MKKGIIMTSLLVLGLLGGCSTNDQTTKKEEHKNEVKEVAKNKHGVSVAIETEMKGIIQHHMDTYNELDIEKYVQTLTKQFNNEETKNNLKTDFEKAKERGFFTTLKNMEVQYLNKEETEMYVWVEAELRTKDFKPEEIYSNNNEAVYVMKKEDGKWKIDETKVIYQKHIDDQSNIVQETDQREEYKKELEEIKKEKATDKKTEEGK